MKRTTVQRLLLVVGAALILYGLGSGRSPKQPHDEPKPTPPIEVREATLKYDIRDAHGKIATMETKPGDPIEIPADVETLIFRAKVINRDPMKSSIRLSAALQELCEQPKAGKSVNKLRHLAESEGVSSLGTDRWVEIRLPVHCQGCAYVAGCGPACDKNHLGEGPHQVTVTASDGGTGEASKDSAIPAKPSSIRFLIRTVCPKEKKKKSRPQSAAI